jgi:uncharacterized membrane protein YhaH (DUF805 family)
MADVNPYDSKQFDANPYRAPTADVDRDAHEAPGATQPVRVFSVSGRIGRVRYIGYSIGLTLLVGALLMALAVFAAVVVRVEAMALVSALGWIAIIGVQLMLTIQRCHDFDTSGWAAVFVVIPLAAFVYWFIPGTDGPNRFGPPTPPNSKTTVALALILPLVFVIGVVAAVVIPAYQTYAYRANMERPAR